MDLDFNQFLNSYRSLSKTVHAAINRPPGKPVTMYYPIRIKLRKA